MATSYTSFAESLHEQALDYYGLEGDFMKDVCNEMVAEARKGRMFLLKELHVELPKYVLDKLSDLLSEGGSVSQTAWVIDGPWRVVDGLRKPYKDARVRTWMLRLEWR